MTQTKISAKDVAELRARTAAGMMDCKRALEEAGGDMSRAAELLRSKGIAKAEKRTGRSTSQGLVVGRLTADAGEGAILELTSETDFVARTEEFGAVATALLRQLADSPPMSLEEFLSQQAAGTTGETVADRVKQTSAKTGEMVAVKDAVKYAPGATGTVGLYLHHNQQVGVLIELASETEEAARSETVRELARELALHVASANPLAVLAEDIPAEVIQRERRIAEEQAAESGKPEAVRGKIVEGKVKKFIAEQVLVDQGWVKDDKKPIHSLMADAAKTVGTTVSVVRFVRLQVGES